MEDPLFGKPARNFAPATIWTGDNLDILRGINSETVDLIYLDPPFNSNRTYSAPIWERRVRWEAGPQFLPPGPAQKEAQP